MSMLHLPYKHVGWYLLSVNPQCIYKLWLPGQPLHKSQYLNIRTYVGCYHRHTDAARRFAELFSNMMIEKKYL